MTQTKIDRDFLKQPIANVAMTSAPTDWLQVQRDRAIALLQEQTFPTRRDEEWRFTDLGDLAQKEFVVAEKTKDSELNISPFQENSHRLVFIDSHYDDRLSSKTDLPAGVFIGNLAAATAANLNLAEYVGNQPGREEIFTALNTAGIQDIAVVWVQKNTIVPFPIEILYTVKTENAIDRPRCLIVVESGAEVTIIERYTVEAAEEYFTNSVTEIAISPGGRVKHCRVQTDAKTAIHIGKTTIVQSRDSYYAGTSVNLGAKLSRHNWEMYQTGAQTETILKGLSLIDGDRLADTHSAIVLSQPHGKADQLQKNIIADRGHAVFNGKINVPQAAQLTNASQLNRNLLLSDRGRVDTKPQLEIVADNVKCAHGATVSQLEDEEIFYLQSRGLDENTSRELLIKAFAMEVIQDLNLPTLVESIQTWWNG
jgi:Fe-S cluster assembly protein SufD